MQLSEGVFQKRVFKMAVFRCEVKTLKRAAGRSAVAAAAYRAADRLRDEQANEGAGKVHDYRRRAPGVAYRETMAPKGAPEWATQRGKLWNEAERAENRRNSVTAREILLSLPHELDDVQRVELVRAFASGLIDRYGVAVDMRSITRHLDRLLPVADFHYRYGLTAHSSRLGTLQALVGPQRRASPVLLDIPKRPRLPELLVLQVLQW